MAKKKLISFKENSDDIRLYNYLCEKKCPSAYVKELIENDLKEQEIKDIKLYTQFEYIESEI
ncbi:MAG: circadian clock-controlled protein [Clostridium sp.]